MNSRCAHRASGSVEAAVSATHVEKAAGNAGAAERGRAELQVSEWEGRQM